MLHTEKLGLLIHHCLAIVQRLQTLCPIHSLIVYHGISDILLSTLTFNRIYPQGPGYIQRDVAAVESPQCASPSRIFNAVL